MTDIVSQSIGGRYQLSAIIGQGGMGRVYRAYDRLTDNTVALKHVSHESTNLQFHSKGTSTDPQLALAKEFQILAALRHPNIISVLDFGFAAFQDTIREPYFTMDLMENAQTVVEAAKDKSLADRVLLILQMLQALVYLHRQGILHRDLKPENVLVNSEGSLLVKVVDFGIAVSPGYFTSNVQNGRIGTLAYLAPELLLKTAASPQSDLYAVGVIAHEILLGVFPYNRATTTYLIHDILNKVPDTAGLSPHLGLVISTLLAKDPAKRYDTADEVIDTLTTALELPRPQETIAIRESFLQASLFVGRESELGELLEALLQAQMQKHGSAWLIGGESGIGKSRLLRELRTRALTEGVLVLEGQATSEGGLENQIWRQPLRRLILEVNLSDSDAANLQGLIPDIERLIGHPLPTRNPDEVGINIAVQHLFEEMAELQRPILLILEDLQWIQPESIKLLNHVIQRIADLPLLVVGSYRDDETEELAKLLPYMKSLKLKRLQEQHIAKLSALMMGKVGEQPEVLSYLTQHTEGNAFILVEVVRALAEEAGRLDDVNADMLPETLLPDGVGAVIRRRLTRVPRGAYDLLKIAAVAGRQLDLDILQTIEPSILVTDWVMQCVAVLEVHEGKWRFAHDKLREAILDELNDNEVREYNRKVALAIESLHPSDSGYAPILIRYWSKAVNIQKEFYYLKVAAREAHGRRASKNAVEYSSRGLALLNYPNMPYSVLDHAQLEFDQGVAYGMLGNFDKAVESLNSALDLYQTINKQEQVVDVLFQLGIVAEFQGHIEESLNYLDKSLLISRQLNYRLGIANGLRQLATVQNRQNKYQLALELSEESLKIYREIGDETLFPPILLTLGSNYEGRGLYKQAMSFFEESLSIARKHDFRRAIIYSLFGAGKVSLDRGHFSEARIYLEECLNLMLDVRERGLSLLLISIATLEASFQNFDVAISHLDEAQQIAVSMKDHHTLAHIDFQRGSLAQYRAEYVLAENYYQKALASLREMRDFGGIAICLCYLAFDQLAQAKFTEGMENLDKALTLILDMSAPPLLHQILVGYAELLRLKGEVTESSMLLGFVIEQDDIPYPYGKHELGQVQDQLMKVLPASEFDTRLKKGANMTLDEAFDLIRRQTS